MTDKLRTTISTAASGALLRIGEHFQDAGLLHQALTPYLKVVAYYPASDEAPIAVERLVTIAEIFEERGRFRMAMSIYDRMEQAARFRRWNGHQFPPEGQPSNRQRKLVRERRSVPLPVRRENGDEEAEEI